MVVRTLRRLRGIAWVPSDRSGFPQAIVALECARMTVRCMRSFVGGRTELSPLGLSFVNVKGILKLLLTAAEPCGAASAVDPETATEPVLAGALHASAKRKRSQRNVRRRGADYDFTHST